MNTDRPSSPAPARRLAIAALCLLPWAAAPGSAAAQEGGLDDVFGELGTAESVDVTAPAEERRPGDGTIRGQIFNGDSGDPVSGVSVVLIWPAPADGGEARQEVEVTDLDGSYEFPSVPPGRYTLSFIKSGFRASTMTDFEVQADQLNEASFPLPPLPTATSEEVLELDAFVVEASTVGEMMDDLILRMDSDQLLNIMSAEDLSKFAASDVADALKRVAGVNIVEGQFAIIRGLEDRYSSTLYNSAPVPSPDPDSQSVQLDLFPSDIVSNLVVVKTFAGDLPSNSAGGSIDIVTHDYPSEFEFKFSAGTGYVDRARDRFLEFNNGSPVGGETGNSDVTESDFSGSMGGRLEFAGRELRLNALLGREIDFGTKEGAQESREPRRRVLTSEDQRSSFGIRCCQPGGLSLGELALSGGRFELTESDRTDQDTSYLGLGYDLDRGGNHRLDGSIFVTRKAEESVQLKDGGYIPGFDYVAAFGDQSPEDANPRSFLNSATLGAWITSVDRSRTNNGNGLWFTTFSESKAFKRDRELNVFQLNGDHAFESIEGLRLRWAGNHARTSQKEDARGVRYYYEPDDENQRLQPPNTVEELGPGGYEGRSDITYSLNEISERQDFFRLDLAYETEFSPYMAVAFNGGFWTESAERQVDAAYLETARKQGSSNEFEFPGRTPQEVGDSIFPSLAYDDDGFPLGTRRATNDSERDIFAWNTGAKATLWDRLDVVANLRRERIEILSNNEPFTGSGAVLGGADRIFPTRYVLFDPLDCYPSETRRSDTSDTIFNNELVNIDPPPADAQGCRNYTTNEAIREVVNGRIEERRTLPSYSLAFRPFEGMSVRTAYSKTVARPSFREMGYYVTVEPGSDDLFVGNPQLGLSDVESWDARFEYTWGAFGDLAALSLFEKEIEEPIESVVVRNPLNAEFSSSALYRTFFNNPNKAKLRGIEVEARKNLGFLGPEFLEYLTIGGNYTFIDAEVDRTDAELIRSGTFFGVADGDSELFPDLERSRRLFGQPEWIANADITFEHPGWGTKLTLALFAISDVLDAAGSANLGPGGDVISFTIDQYIDSFHQLDLILSQDWQLEFFPGDVKFKLSVKNLTDSKRQVIYDPEQTRHSVAERSYRVGLDYSLSLTYSVAF